MTPRERLAVWMESSGLSQEAAAAKLGCTQAFVSAIIRGTKRPGLAVAHAIQRETTAAPSGIEPIRMEDWIEPTVESSATGTEG